MSETPDPTRLTFREFTREPVGGYIDIEKHWTEAELRDIFDNGSLVLSILDKCADLQAENARLTAALRPLALYRCRGCGARWLFWGGDVAGLQEGTWNLLDQWQCPGECCDNAPMGDQMEFVRDIVARAALTPKGETQ